jgi:glycine/D-amino acid oxidase-like deaminating enzyme
MEPKINQFYLDKTYGIVRFVGYEPDGVLMFDKYEQSFERRGKRSGWLEAGQRVKMEPDYSRRRIQGGYLRPIPPPQ